MLPETRRAALRAAGLVAGLAGAACSPAPPPQVLTIPASDVPTKDIGPASNGGGTEPTPSFAQCNRIVDEAFPPGDPYPFNENMDVAPVVRACCAQAMSSHEARSTGILARHRWDCCGAIAKMPVDVGSFCAPWGPPVPPPMARRERLRLNGYSRAELGLAARSA